MRKRTNARYNLTRKRIASLHWHQRSNYFNWPFLRSSLAFLSHTLNEYHPVDCYQHSHHPVVHQHDFNCVGHRIFTPQTHAQSKRTMLPATNCTHLHSASSSSIFGISSCLIYIECSPCKRPAHCCVLFGWLAWWWDAYGSGGCCKSAETQKR